MWGFPLNIKSNDNSILPGKRSLFKIKQPVKQ